MIELIDKINGFKYLKKNWDSYDADPISEIAIIKSLEIVSYIKDFKNLYKISVFPMRNGGIQFEFDADINIELEVVSNGELIIKIYDILGNILTTDFFSEISTIKTLMNKNDDREILHPFN